MKQAILEYVRNEYLDEDDEDDIELTETTPLISSGIVDSFSMVRMTMSVGISCAIARLADIMIAAMATTDMMTAETNDFSL